MLKHLILGLGLTAALSAQTFPGFNVVLDPDKKQRAWTGLVFNGKPAVFVFGRGGDFLEFIDPAVLPAGTRSIRLELAAWGVLDNRACAPRSLAGLSESNFCDVNNNRFFCIGAATNLAEGRVPNSGLLWPAALPSTPSIFDWHKALNPFAVANSPIRYSATYCGPKGCDSDCSRSGPFILPSRPETFGAVFYLR